MRVLGVDPGGTTGVVVVDTLDWSVVDAQYDEFRAVVSTIYLLFKVDPVSHVAIERYTISPRTLTKTRQNTALEVIGFVRGLCLIHNVPCTLQLPADAKLVWSDERLERHGMRARGPHARDALRHALRCLQRMNVIPPAVTV